VSTILAADLILVLDTAAWSAGTHHELARGARLYAALYERQFRPRRRGPDLALAAE